MRLAAGCSASDRIPQTSRSCRRRRLRFRKASASICAAAFRCVAHRLRSTRGMPSSSGGGQEGLFFTLPSTRQWQRATWSYVVCPPRGSLTRLLTTHRRAGDRGAGAVAQARHEPRGSSGLHGRSQGNGQGGRAAKSWRLHHRVSGPRALRRHSDLTAVDADWPGRTSHAFGYPYIP